MTSDPPIPEPFDFAAWTPAPPRVRDARFAATARRVALLLLVLAAHGLLFERLLRQEWRAPDAATDPLLILSFIEAREPERQPPPPEVLRIRRGGEARPPRSPRVTRPMSAPPDPPAPPAAPPETVSQPLRLFRADGSLVLPDAVADDLAKATDPRREFGFQVPGVVEAQARAHAPQRRPIDYQGTRFEPGWIEETDPITAGLEKVVEKTTVTIRIPLPRAPGSKAVCKFSFAAMAGGCGIRNESDGYFVRDDDPDTLDAAEAAQCAVWWDEVVQATTPAQLRIARDRYETQCRKPLAAGGAPPP